VIAAEAANNEFMGISYLFFPNVALGLGLRLYYFFIRTYRIRNVFLYYKTLTLNHFAKISNDSFPLRNPFAINRLLCFV